MENNLVLTLTLNNDGESTNIFTMTRDEYGHLDVKAADDLETLIAAVDKVQEMIDYVRGDADDAPTH